MYIMASQPQYNKGDLSSIIDSFVKASVYFLYYSRRPISTDNSTDPSLL